MAEPIMYAEFSRESLPRIAEQFVEHHKYLERRLANAGETTAIALCDCNECAFYARYTLTKVAFGVAVAQVETQKHIKRCGFCGKIHSYESANEKGDKPASDGEWIRVTHREQVPRILREFLGELLDEILKDDTGNKD